MQSKNIIFDIGGTLYNGKACTTFGLSEINKKLLLNILSDKELEKLYTDIYSKEPIKHGDIVLGEIDHFRRLAQESNFTGDPAILLNDYKKSVLKKMDLFDDVENTLKELVYRGYKLYILSNGRSKNQIYKLKYWDIQSLFTGIVISEDVDIIKPDESIFKHLLSSQNIKPESCIMIGDSIQEDILPSINLGMKGVLFSSIKNENIPNFSNYKQLPGLLETL